MPSSGLSVTEEAMCNFNEGRGETKATRQAKGGGSVEERSKGANTVSTLPERERGTRSRGSMGGSKKVVASRN